MKKEIWRIIPNFPDYAASSRGRIKRIADRKTSIGADPIIKQRVDQWGYSVVTLMKPGGRGRGTLGWTPAKVSRCVCAAFKGLPPSPKHQAAHLDGNRLNNATANLRWKTPKENDLDKDRHGTRQRGEKQGNAVLTDEKARQIRKDRAGGMVWALIAEKHGCSIRNARDVCSGRTWLHV